MKIFLTLVFYLVFQNDLGASECPDDDEYDYIIVGGGTTGGVVAARLSENSKVKVLLIEAGGEPAKNSSIPLLAFDQLGTEMDWNYTSTSQQHCCDIFNLKSIPLYRGRALGGTSSLDAMLYARGNKKDYDSWAAAGNDGWSNDDVMPYFRKLENYIFPHDSDDDSLHGTDGPITVSHTDFKTKAAEAFIAAVTELGQPTVDYNGKTQTGFTFTPNTIANGSRCNSYTGYLKPAMSRSNLKVLTHTLATRIVVDSDKRATGVEFTTKCTKLSCNKECTVNAKKEVIISAGVYNTPQLLMLSGIGPRDTLTKFLINVVKDLPGVGQNLQDHTTVAGQFYTLNDKVTLNKKRYNTKKYLDEWHKDETGPMTVGAGFETDGFYQSKLVTDTDYPDIEVLVNSDNVISLIQKFISPALLETMPKADKDVITFLPAVMRPKSRGTVTLKSKNPFDAPIINPNLLAHPDDVATLAEGIKFVLSIGRTKAFEKYNPKLYLNGSIPYCASVPDKTSDAYYKCVASKLALALFHTSSSCKMGPEKDSMAVVDNTLKVHGIKGLRVADASIMPNIVSAHPNPTCLMIGEKASDMIKNEKDEPKKGTGAACTCPNSGK